MADIENTADAPKDGSDIKEKVARAAEPKQARKDTPIERADAEAREAFKKEFNDYRKAARPEPAQPAQAEAPKVEEAPKAAKEEPKAVEAPVTPPAPVAAAPAVAVAPATPAAPVAPPAKPNAVGLQISQGDQHILEIVGHRLDEYAKTMAKGVPMKPADGAKEQKKLFGVLDSVLRLQGAAFVKGWSIILQKVAEHRQGVFSEAYAYRFYEHTGIEAKSLRTYRNLIHLAMHTADPKSRQRMMKLVDIQTVTAELRVPGAADRLYSYYHH